MATSWKIDGTVNLTETCEKANWHLATAIDALMAAGLSRGDAEAFANFQFSDRAKHGEPADQHVNDEQWDRLTCD